MMDFGSDLFIMCQIISADDKNVQEYLSTYRCELVDQSAKNIQASMK